MSLYHAALHGHEEVRRDALPDSTGNHLLTSVRHALRHPSSYLRTVSPTYYPLTLSDPDVLGRYHHLSHEGRGLIPNDSRETVAPSTRTAKYTRDVLFDIALNLCLCAAGYQRAGQSPGHIRETSFRGTQVLAREDLVICLMVGGSKTYIVQQDPNTFIAIFCTNYSRSNTKRW